ncbi:group 1 truncated hemoglobin [uncultured Roseibium sp.]|uniref:group I truncated hemoglobin n=1 Tax=uncultured Roseibium sp. TaxID=1936171 RepID=UPI0026054279|nr:group 1 truncated hemoglobin [uncultured Roseibium sp.]
MSGKTQTLYEKYGGFPGVRQVVTDFYERALDSDIVGHFFEDVNMARLVDHQTKMIAGLLGGPVEISDARLATAHAHLNVDHYHFDEIAVLLNETLVDAGFDKQDRLAAIAAVEARRSVIVRRSRAA